MHVIIILLLILAVLLVIFTLQNSIGITIHVFFWEITNVPLVLVIIGCIIAGYILAASYYYPRILKLKKEIRQLLKLNPHLKEQYNQIHSKNKMTNKEKVGDETHPEGYLMDED